MSDAWRIAGRLSSEVQFRTNLEMGGGAFRDSIERRVKNARTNTTLNKVAMSIILGFFIAIYGFITRTLTFFPIVLPGIHTGIEVAVITSLFLGIAFTLLMFIGLMQSTTYVSCDIASLTLQLPITNNDAEKIAFLGYFRLFDIPILVVLVGFPIALGIATFSILGSLACLATTAITIVLAISVLLLLSHLFYTRIQSLGGSRFRGFIRILFVLFWAFSFVAFSLSYQLISYLIPLIQLLTVTATTFDWILPLLFPFSLGYFVAFLSGLPGLSSVSLITCLIGTLLYITLGLLGLRQSRRILISVSQAPITPQLPTKIKPISVQSSSHHVAIIQKDLRLASRNPSQAIFLITPIATGIILHFSLLSFLSLPFPADTFFFMIIAITPFMIIFFSIFLLSTETHGASLTSSLPLHTRVITQSKALLATFSYLPLFIIQIILLFILPLQNPPFLLAIIVSQIPLVYTTSLIAISLFVRLLGGGRIIGFNVGQHLLQMIGVLLITLIFFVLPWILYMYIWFDAVRFGIPLIYFHLYVLLGFWAGLFINSIIGFGCSRLLLRD
ncbi:MAG: hypothetical protein ACFFCJ_05560 [Promethearchaeota archaeon]